jgi:DnaJ-class molecular chaperone
MPWFQKKTKDTKSIICPVCDGKGVRIDKITNKQRPCVLCNGAGSTPQKGNARVLV